MKHHEDLPVLHLVQWADGSWGLPFAEPKGWRQSIRFSSEGFRDTLGELARVQAAFAERLRCSSEQQNDASSPQSAKPAQGVPSEDGR